MLNDFLLFGDLPANHVVGTYNFGLVVLSYVIAVLASYVALDMASQLGRGHSKRIARFWHVGGAIVLGAGIWSMHFTGMLAYDMMMEHSYDVRITLLSLVLPIIVSYVVFLLIDSPHLNAKTVLKAAPFLGIGVAGMHYLGMLAMNMRAELLYTPGWFVISLLIAFLASAGAMLLTFIATKTRPGSQAPYKLLGAMVMGAAICGMHYAAMQAAVIIPYADCRFLPAGSGRNVVMALAVGVVMLVILCIAITALAINQKVAERLKDEVDKRTGELEMANHELTIAKEVAEAASISKSQFLANMSHEIRTPMNAIMGIAGLLQADQVPQERRKEYIDMLQQSAATLLTLIDELLDISKVETNTIELESIAFDLKQHIEEVMALIRIRAQEKGLMLQVIYPAHVPSMFMGDPLRMRQIMVNLISNAVKFTDKGGVTVRVDASRVDATFMMDVTIIVADSGIGIQTDKLSKIFEKFIQADSSMTRRYGGTGLGLAITKGLVEKMRGVIKVDSEIGKGAVFTVKIPLALAASNDVPEKTARVLPFASAKAAPADTRNNKPVVLVVEDNPGNILVATTFLEQLGYAHEIARNGVEAVEKYASSAYAIVLMDVQLPGMDGYEATGKIRDIEKRNGWARAKVIAMTAFAYEGDKEKCLDAGMDDYIAKPVVIADLEAKISQS